MFQPYAGRAVIQTAITMAGSGCIPVPATPDGSADTVRDTRKAEAWVNLEISPREAPEITRIPSMPDEPDVFYAVEWPAVGLALTLTAAELNEMMSRAMVAQAIG